MKAIIISFCLIWAVYANPIFFNAALESHEREVNSTESLSLSQSSENDTLELQSSEESISNQSSSSESSESSESESLENNTSEESNSDSVESDVQTDLLVETRDDSMGSEENIRKSWVRVFATVVQDLSAEDNSTEVKGQPQLTSNKMTEKQPTPGSTVKTSKQRKMALVEKPTDSSVSSSESADSSDSTALTVVTADSSQSLSSESNETSEASDSAQSSESVEDSDGSDSTELGQLKVKDCVNGTQSCESEEYFFQDIGDDAHYSVDNLLVPDEDDRELSLRR